MSERRLIRLGDFLERTAVPFLLGFTTLYLLIAVGRMSETTATYQLEGERLVTFRTWATTCHETRAALARGDRVETTAPWGERARVERIGCDGERPQ